MSYNYNHPRVTARRRIAPTKVEATPPPKRSPLLFVRSFLTLLLLPAVIFGGIVAYASYEHFRTTAPPPGGPGALVWSDGQVIFANTNEVAAWMRKHGGTFESFKKNHPTALELVKGKAPQTQQKVAAAVPASEGSSNGLRHDRIGLGVLGGLALLLLLIALAPAGLLIRLHVPRLRSASEVRILSGGAAVAIAAGLAVALLL